MRCSRCQSHMQTQTVEANAHATLLKHHCPLCARTTLTSAPRSLRQTQASHETLRAGKTIGSRYAFG